ncbi:hypothetical protein B0H63DRAFT_188924 [Podospora didyma]|uniref:Uncharacterized protein n=1 Tax=Podospora didyma TaxID=330526 RepID=A0AAE0NR17_9PEZI|nr:hypothetical protein B0H63DRAFT_188924 [Podospora didyma]
MLSTTVLSAAVGAVLIGTSHALPAQQITARDFSGQGQIHVLNSSSLAYATPLDRIGCLDEHGVVTVRDCATFTTMDKYPHTISSRVGACTFRDTNAPTNSDSVYGKDSHAWTCQPYNEPSGTQEIYYTVNGFKYPFLCNGNLNCYYDIKTAPSLDDDKSVAPRQTKVPVWQFYWGSDQMGITPGHLQVLWLWVPYSSTVIGPSD